MEQYLQPLMHKLNAWNHSVFLLHVATYPHPHTIDITPPRPHTIDVTPPHTLHSNVSTPTSDITTSPTTSDTTSTFEHSPSRRSFSSPRRLLPPASSSVVPVGSVPQARLGRSCSVHKGMGGRRAEGQCNSWSMKAALKSHCIKPIL